MPDTGASQSIVSAVTARDANLKILPTHTELRNASGGIMRLLGEAKVVLCNDRHLLDNEVHRLEFSNVLVYYILYQRESRHARREESMTCRNDKSGVGPRRKHNNRVEVCS